MGERRQIAARAHTAAGRDNRRDTSIQEIAKTTGDERTDPGETFRKNIRPDQHHGTHFESVHRLANASRMRTNHVSLQRFEIVVRDADIRKQADPGIDCIHGRFSISE
jgi:hypothetical protein